MKQLTTAILAATTALGISTASAQDTPEPQPEYQPDLVLKSATGEPVGNDIYGRPVGQTIRNKTTGPRPVRYAIGVQNDGTEDDRIRVRGTGSDRKFRVAYLIGDRNVTAGMRRGVPLPIAAGEEVRIGATVKATRATKGRNARKVLRYAAGSSNERRARDSAAAFVLKHKAGDRDRES